RGAVVAVLDDLDRLDVAAGHTDRRRDATQRPGDVGQLHAQQVRHAVDPSQDLLPRDFGVSVRGQAQPEPGRTLRAGLHRGAYGGAVVGHDARVAVEQLQAVVVGGDEQRAPGVPLVPPGRTDRLTGGIAEPALDLAVPVPDAPGPLAVRAEQAVPVEGRDR